VIVDKVPVMVAGGVESISCVQNEANRHMIMEAWLKQNKPEVYWPMLQTAETVAKRYNIARELQDQYGARSQQRAAAAQAAGKFNDEIVPITVTMPASPTRPAAACSPRK
jgi:acetyl-CoA C-acetyltransferase